MNAEISKALFADQVANLTDRLLATRSWVVNSREYPTLDVTFLSATRSSLRVRLQCSDWNTAPPSIELLSESGEFLTTRTIPVGSGVINAGQHPVTQRPFICTPGSLEYHTHSSHIGDGWDNYKGKSSFSLGEILTQVYSAWLTTSDNPHSNIH
jgi:hypothetical protein